ncbi:S-layer homology domain-containing protein [Geobacillus sp. 47C-IIb]|uniref:S-layer homology domain-containing protein n=2 Tax=Geobacillus sp. 47C-IIb TaxID=1963026 RepID=UPI0016801132|nr:S-layer homology domain-containing protein [Geobacillus sp. 47C-IIb]QNU32620.1 S-layer homology domain-containing protein [Geobacillus sp. 47C-IIb]
MAYQPKSYRKFAATTATAAMVASAVAPVASLAAGFTDVAPQYKDAVDFLVSTGATNGKTETQFGVYEQITRLDAAVILAKVLKLDVDNAKDAGFTDVPKDRAKYVNALVEAGILNGKSEGKFGAYDNLTRVEMAKIIANAYKLEKQNDNALPFTDVNATWAPFVKALYDNGVTSGKTETSFGAYENITRGDFAQFVYRAANLDVAPEVVSVSAINAKTLKVTFNKAVDDTKAKFEVKKGSVTVNVAKTTFSADKKSVELELASKLFEGEYTVNVTGLADQALTGSVKVENEKVAKIELLGEVAPINAQNKKQATVAYRVFNQYGEDITKSPLASSISWTASNGVDAQDDDKGVLTLTNTSDFKTGDKVAITGINVSTNTVVSGVVTISDASATDTVEFVGIYNKDGKEFSGDLAVGDFVLLLNAKDQYGNDVNASKVNDDVVFTSSNPSVLTIDKAYDGQGKDKDKIGLKFTAGPNYANGGKVIITAISKTSGKVAQFEVNVKAAPALDTFTLGTPTEIVAAGEKVKLPFTAVDQYGNTVTKYEALEGKVTFNTDKAKLVKDASGNAVLEYTAPDTKGLQVLVATVVGSGKVSQLTIDVKEAAYAATIESLKNVTTTVAKDGKVEISLSNLVVKDQYGRTFDLKDKLTNTENGASLGRYKIVVTDSENGAVKVAGAEITANDGKITITGLEKGSEEVTFKLQRVEKIAENTYKFKDVATSPLKVTFNTVDKSAFTSFEIGEIGKLYADGTKSTHAKALKVYGVKADGTKVELPSNYYNVIVDSNVLTFTDGKLDVKLDAETDKDKFGTKDEITTKVTVIVEGEEDPVTLTKDIVVSKVKPKADKIEFTDVVKNGTASIAVADLTDENDAADLSAVLKVTDQYGVEIADPAPIITVTNIKEKTVDTDPAQRFKVDRNGSRTVDIQNVEAGDTFTVTYLLDGKTATVKFIVTE